jgi:MFS family permease
VARVGAGIAGATIATAQAVIADCTMPEKRAHGMALIGAAFGIGFTFGPLIAWIGEGLFLGDAGQPGFREGPGYLAAGLSLIALLLGVWLLPETRRPGVAAPHRKFDLGRMYRTLQTPTVGLLVLTFFLATYGFANFEGTLSLLTLKVFDYNDRDNYLVFAFVGFMLMIAQGGVYRPMAKRVSEVSFMRAGIVLMLLGLASLAAVVASADSPADALGLKPWFYLSLTLAVFGFAFLTPSVQALISRRSDPNRQGEVLGVNQGFAALARILGPLTGTLLFYLEDRHMLPFLLGAVLLLGLLAMVPRIKQEQPAAAL